MDTFRYSDWKFESISLSNYINQDDIVIKFRNVNQYENNLFIDNLNINTSVTNFGEQINPNKKLLKIIDILEKLMKNQTCPLFYIYEDGSTERKFLLNRIFLFTR